jgi:hypothetical protein
MTDMNHDEFFEFCKAHGLNTAPEIAAAFNVSSQTIRNWRAGKRLPGWLSLACTAYAKHRDNLIDIMPTYPRMTVDWFKGWQRRNGLNTYEKTGLIFGLKRQAIHNWFRRKKFPNWIVLGCIGLDCERETQREAA